MPDANPAAPSPVSPGRVLVVDDDAALLLVMRELLAEAGYDVTFCADGRAALEVLARGHFDAVLSDVCMPGLDGLGLLRAVRDTDLDLPVVLFTGGPSVESAIEAVERGALQYLVKPVAADRLIEATGRAVKLGALARLKREALLASGFQHLVGDRVRLEASFEHALESLWMAFQPIVRRDGRLHAHEALLRSSEALFPHPGALLTAAEHLRRLPDVGRATRAAVARALAEDALPAEVFVNLHPRDLEDDALLDPRAPLSSFASRVVLEVTERASLESVAGVAERVGALRGLGYRIALDDLGAGYSGLASFAALSPDVVKLDMALVRGLDHDEVKHKLVASMAALCHDLGILVAAEGIETAGERDAVLAAGCDLLQGFLIGRPARACRGDAAHVC